MRRSNERQEAIRSIVRGQSVRTQGELVEALAERGFACTQSTGSRDVSEMHLRKLAGGLYVLEEDLNLQLVLSEFVVETRSAPGQALVVVLTQPETAQSVARVIDEARLDHVLGTIAGHDTVFVATDSPTGADEVRNAISALATSG